MYTICPNCKSKNTQCVHTEIDKVTCECLDCKHRFDRFPTVAERDAFNN